MKTSLQTVLMAAALLLSSTALAAPTAQTPPPPPPPVAAPVCDLMNNDGTANAGVDVGDSAYASTDLDDNGTCAVTGPAGSCSRVSCYNTSGIFLCANTDNPPPTGCDFVAGIAGNIRSACGDSGQTEGVSGYADNGSWRVYVAYANCNVSPSAGVFDQHT